MYIQKYSETGNLNHFQVLEVSFQERLSHGQTFVYHS